MRQINHPSIVKLISFSESDEHYFLVLERKSIHSSSHTFCDIIFSAGGWGVVPSNVLSLHFLTRHIIHLSLPLQSQINLLQRKPISTRHPPGGERNPLSARGMWCCTP